MAKVAVIGDATSVAGFAALGVAAFEVERPSDARDLWPLLSAGAYAVIFMTEPVYAATEDLAGGIAHLALPAVTVIPGAGGRSRIGEAKLSRAIERALGARLPVEEEED